MMESAQRLTLEGHGRLVSYSRKVFIPLTQSAATFVTIAPSPKRRGRSRVSYLSIAEVLDIARAGAAAGCKEALFTLGDQPELRYAAARSGLSSLGYATTLDYLAAAAKAVFQETGLLPHLNPGVMSDTDIERLRPLSVSMGLMLESAAERLAERGGPHFGSPDKHPAVRLATLEAAGGQRVPFTTGLLIGIGETRAERLEALLAIRECTDATEISRKSSFKISAPSRVRRWPARRNPSRGTPLERRGGALPVRARQYPPGTPESAAGRLGRADPRRCQRLGRCLTGHARPCQSRGSMAASRAAECRTPWRIASWSSGSP